MFTKKDINRIMSTERVGVRIGRRGVSKGLVAEIKRQLDQRGYVKIKILKNIRGHISEEDIEKLAKEVGGRIASRRGYVYLIISLKRRKSSKQQ